MSILWLPPELLMLIAQQLECRDLNALLQVHPILYHQLNDCLYYCNVQYDGSSVIFWAAKSGSEKTFQRLLNARADVCWKSDYWNLAQTRAPRAPHLRRRAEGLREHPISVAASNGHIEIVRSLIEQGVDINFKDPDGCSPLALAARDGHLALVQLLVSLGACQLSYDRDGQRPIGNAASRGQHAIEDYLLQELKKFPYLKWTVQAGIQWMLLYAAQRGDENRIKYLVTMGADINFQFKVSSCTPLFGAVVHAPSPLRVVKLLLELGADPNIRRSPSKITRPRGSSPERNHPIHHAIKRDESYDLIKVLLQFGAHAAGRSLFRAVSLQKPAEFRLLVENGADIHFRLRNISVFSCALDSSCEDIRNVILGRGITPETPDLARRHRKRIDNQPPNGTAQASTQ